jgi:hypothetical protein
MGVCVAILFASCLPGPNGAAVIVEPEAKPAGFLLGLWHGAICVISFVISLFKKDVNIYEVFNNGWQYNAGFILGAMISLGGSAKGSCSKRKDKHC